MHKQNILFCNIFQYIQRGVISLWDCQSNRNLSPLYTFKLKHGCFHVTLYTNSQHRENPNLFSSVQDQQKDNQEEVIISAFYLSNNAGKIFLTTNEASYHDILDLQKTEENKSGNIHFRLLQYINGDEKLIFITDDMTLYIYDIVEINKLELDKPYKLSISKSNMNVDVICIYLFNGLIAISNQESSIRIFDIINNENYILSLTDSRHMAQPNDTIDKIKLISSTKI